MVVLWIGDALVRGPALVMASRYCYRANRYDLDKTSDHLDPAYDHRWAEQVAVAVDADVVFAGQLDRRALSDYQGRRQHAARPTSHRSTVGSQAAVMLGVRPGQPVNQPGVEVRRRGEHAAEQER